MNKIVRIAAIISALVLVPALPSFAAGFVPTGINEDKTGKVAFTVEDLPDGAPWISLATAQDAPGTSPTNSSTMCHSFTKDDCATSTNMFGTAIMPVCGEIVENCIAGLKIYKVGEEPVAAKFIKQVQGFTFPSEPQYGNPQGSTPSVWESNVVNAGGSTKYVVSPHINFSITAGRLHYANFSANVFPIVDKFAANFRPSDIRTVTENGYRVSNHDNGENTGNDLCAATETGWCAYRSDFAPNTRVELDLKLSNAVTGWLHGRLTAPEIEVTNIDGNFNAVSITGNPVEIPMMYAVIDKSKASAAVQDALSRGNNSWGGLHQNGELWRKYSSDNSLARTLIPEVAASIKDTAADSNTSWQVKSIQTQGYENECLKDTSRLIGLVTTNAMAYAGGAPAWENNTLAYEVAGLHYMPDGKTAVEGTYDLAIRSDTARCLYGFSKAPISATINVTGANGETKTATTVVNEKDGWLKLAAYGFTFSSPTISVKLSQAKAPAKKTTISCAKGKLVKKVTAVGPKCPAGYKKK